MQEINERRRNLIKFAAFGAAAFVLGKVLGPSLSVFGDTNDSGSSKKYKNYRVVDNDRELRVYDPQGNELVMIEKDAV